MKLKNFRRSQHYAQLLEQYLKAQNDSTRLHLDEAGTSSLSAWFLGPRAENEELFKDLIIQSLDACVSDRKQLFNSDPRYITPQRKDAEYEKTVQQMKSELEKLLKQLEGSVPFFSYRYQAHMNWDLTMPAMAGYFAAMLYNQNNVALEASPVTSRLEKLVGDDLCKMLGFDISTTAPIRPWGHITCDGSVANLEAMWAARNIKYYPLSVKAVLLGETKLTAAKDLQVTTWSGDEKKRVPLVSLDAWSLINLSVDEVLNLPSRIQEKCQLDANEFSELIDAYLLQSMGFESFMTKLGTGTNPSVIMGPATKHYSWPKNAALTGIGKDNFINIPVDDNARMSSTMLKINLDECLRKKQPVAMVIAVLGSTEESAVDPLAEIIELRETYRKKGLNFVIHIDAAWGGYFASMLRKPDTQQKSQGPPTSELQPTPVMQLSNYVTNQYKAIPQADSITIDPHKAGYIPYAAGGLCYRNSKMRNLIAFLAPEVYHGSEVDSNMGIFGVEGSKPGAAAAGVYLSHRVVRPDQSGYGKILGQALFNSKRFYSAVITMAEEKDPFIVVPVQMIPAERQKKSPEDIREQLNFIKNEIAAKENSQLTDKAMDLLKELGSDQIIITYGLNFKNGNGSLNTDPVRANDFMHEVFKNLSLQPDKSKMPELIITTSEFDPNDYGPEFVSTYMQRLGLQIQSIPTMNFISSTTMCPWLSATEEGNFIPALIQAFKRGIYAALPKL